MSRRGCTVFLSSRLAEDLPRARLLLQELRSLGISTHLHDSGIDDYRTAMRYSKLVVVLGTHEYGTNTGLGFSTHRQLGTAIELRKPMVLVKMCERFHSAEVEDVFRVLSHRDGEVHAWPDGAPVPAELVQAIVLRLPEEIQREVHARMAPAAAFGPDDDNRLDLTPSTGSNDDDASDDRLAVAPNSVVCAANIAMQLQEKLDEKWICTMISPSGPVGSPGTPSPPAVVEIIWNDETRLQESDLVEFESDILQSRLRTQADPSGLGAFVYHLGARHPDDFAAIARHHGICDGGSVEAVESFWANHAKALLKSGPAGAECREGDDSLLLLDKTGCQPAVRIVESPDMPPTVEIVIPGDHDLTESLTSRLRARLAAILKGSLGQVADAATVELRTAEIEALAARASFRRGSIIISTEAKAPVAAQVSLLDACGRKLQGLVRQAYELLGVFEVKIKGHLTFLKLTRPQPQGPGRRSDVFVSYRNGDEYKVAEAVHSLVASKGLTCFWDCHPHDGIRGGEALVQSMIQNLRTAEVVLPIVSWHSHDTFWPPWPWRRYQGSVGKMAHLAVTDASPDWVLFEWECILWLRDYNKSRFPGREPLPVILPVYIGDIFGKESEVPDILHRVTKMECLLALHAIGDNKRAAEVANAAFAKRTVQDVVKEIMRPHKGYHASGRDRESWQQSLEVALNEIYQPPPTQPASPVTQAQAQATQPTPVSTQVAQATPQATSESPPLTL
eukprot:m.243748 g.243748  ORF g.243748 m.243748 type:complete len:733 (+) comp14303_c0_seq1:188-2386(+)